MGNVIGVRDDALEARPVTAPTGRRALVTGASSEIGAATARLLAARGMRVVVNYLHSGTEAEEVVADIEATGGKAMAVAVETMIAQVQAAWAASTCSCTTRLPRTRSSRSRICGITVNVVEPGPVEDTRMSAVIDEKVKQRGVHARVIDCYSIKPLDVATFAAAVDATGGRIVVAEDHHPEGGLGSAIKDALLDGGFSHVRIVHLAVRGMPGSGTGAQLLGWAGIDAEHIAAAARQLLSSDRAEPPRD